MKKAIALIGAMAAAAVLGAPATTQAEDEFQVGMLQCEQDPERMTNWVLYSNKGLNCEFVASDGRERYKGTMGVMLGVDLEWTQSKMVHYAVFSAGGVGLGRHALAGQYVGPKASATAGVGVGAQVLIGGNDDRFTLQPLALEGNIGFGAAAGLGYLTLTPAP